MKTGLAIYSEPSQDCRKGCFAIKKAIAYLSEPEDGGDPETLGECKGFPKNGG
ncbi:MAG: hypothetical protein WCE56_06450 [Desulfobacterales bacterium]